MATGKTAQQVKHISCKPGNLSSDTQRWKQRNASTKLSSALHTCTRACAYPHKQEYFQLKFTDTAFKSPIYPWHTANPHRVDQYSNMNIKIKCSIHLSEKQHQGIPRLNTLYTEMIITKPEKGERIPHKLDTFLWLKLPTMYKSHT